MTSVFSTTTTTTTTTANNIIIISSSSSSSSSSSNQIAPFAEPPKFQDHDNAVVRILRLCEFDPLT